LRRILPYRTVDARIDGVVITFVDLTAQVEADAQARRLATVLRDSNDAVSVWDVDGRIVAWNRGAERMYGYSEAEATKLNVRDVIDGEGLAKTLSAAERIVRGETVEPFEIKRRSRDGRAIDVLLTIAPLNDESGRAVALATTERDITAEKTLQEEIVRTATYEQRRIGQELHDATQQELTGLGLLAQNLSDALRRDSPGPNSELAARLAAGIAQTNEHVRSLAAGLVPQLMDAWGLMAALEHLATTTQSYHKVSCTFECSAPVFVDDAVVATHLYRIAQEAVTNTIKHAKADALSIRLERNDRRLELEVQDNGIGIQHDGAPQGLGLRTMRYRCGAIGGDLTIEQPKGGGTKVVCSIPIRADAA
jgi:PAS domain S-box-containing protein